VRLILVLALALTLAGCAPDLRFRLDPTFSEEAVAGILEAAREWNAITNADHQITFDGDSWYVANAAPPNGPWSGLTRRHERRIWIRPQPAGGTSYHLIAKHEFGHALGLRHLCWTPKALGELVENAPACDSSISLGVMDPAHGDISFSDADIQECIVVGACD
jgi:hypothetical protein